MKPIAVRPRKFKVEFEELGDGRAKIRYEGEFSQYCSPSVSPGW